jgi:uncharacterized protein (TIGR03382 family)
MTRRTALFLLACAVLLAATPAAAQTGNAVALDGSTDFLDLGELTPGQDFTFEAWVRIDNVVLSQTIVSAAELADAFNALLVGYVAGDWTIELDEDDAYEGDDCAEPNTFCLTQALPTGVAMHVALSVQGTTATLFLDGSQVGQFTADSPPVFGADTWILGAETDGGSFGSDALQGVFDEVRLWSVARTEADIQCTKDWTLTGAEGGLYAHWPMDENVFAGVAPDTTGGGWDALLIGDAVFVTSPFALTDSVGSDIPCLDGDSDGYTVADGDCDDDDPNTWPGAPEIAYDGADNDCAGNGDLTDLDGDGFDATVVGGDDCDDTQSSVNPDATEVPYNGADDDCDEDSPDDDLDGDGHPIATDCDDDDPTVYPGATEVPDDGIDQDCDGADLTSGDDDDATPPDDDDVVDDDDATTDDDDVQPDDDDFVPDDDDSALPPVPERRIGCECGQETSSEAFLPLALLLGLGLGSRRRCQRRRGLSRR